MLTYRNRSFDRLRSMDRRVRRCDTTAPNFELSGELLPDFILRTDPEHLFLKGRDAKRDLTKFTGPQFDDARAKSAPGRTPKRFPPVRCEIDDHPLAMEEGELLTAHAHSHVCAAAIRNAKEARRRSIGIDGIGQDERCLKLVRY